MKEIVAVDVDDTLLDENNAIREFINLRYGFSHTPGDYLVTGEYYGFWERIWDVKPELAKEMYEAFLRSTFKTELKPMPGALKALRQLKARYELVVVTSRGEGFEAMTHESLTTHYPGTFKDVHFVPLWGDGEKVTKATICQEIGAYCLIDDNYDHCRLAAEVGVRALLFGDLGWNRQPELPEGMERCRDWPAVTRALLA